MLRAAFPILGLAAPSGTGKTTLMCQLLPLLRAQGVRVGAIKHSHHDFAIDQPGKDSYRVRQAGASPVLLVSQYRRVMIWECPNDKEPTLAEQICHFSAAEIDLLLVEGFRHEAFPKIELHRGDLQQPLYYAEDPHIIAIASDCFTVVPLSLSATLPVLDLNDPLAIAHFILDYFHLVPR